MILIFGKTGQVATELQRMGDVLALSRDLTNLSNPSSCYDAIKIHAPKAVINAAAYTDVDKAETEEELATLINGNAPKAMAKACATLNIPFVHLSTDYVFDGTGVEPWQPEDTTKPQNAYGRSKKTGEDGIQSVGSTYCILRTSWVISSHGTNFVKTMLNLSENRDTLNLVADQIGGPTPAKDIAKACLQIVEQLKQDPSKSGTYHFSGAEDLSWADFATEIFQQTGRSVHVLPIPTSEYPTPAVRPLNSRLNCSKTQEVFSIHRPDWRIGLNDILNELGVIR
jgi:dTDP-4-dehydrorhamnose reductase